MKPLHGERAGEGGGLLCVLKLIKAVNDGEADRQSFL